MYYNNHKNNNLSSGILFDGIIQFIESSALNVIGRIMSYGLNSILSIGATRQQNIM